jgi:aminoglycoside phosphotransferase family enzyme
VDPIIGSQLKSLAENSGLFDARVHEGRIIEAHGDLRPEHICLEPQPVIIDCLEFNRDLRTLDVASELTFLSLECERLGAPEIGIFIFTRYREETGDSPGSQLLTFYRNYHACIRAKLAMLHLHDDGLHDRTKWIAKAQQYLNMAVIESKAV